MLDELLKELEELKKAREILEWVYVDIGPYGARQLQEETLNLIRNYFDFDDSE